MPGIYVNYFNMPRWLFHTNLQLTLTSVTEKEKLIQQFISIQ